MKIMNNATFIEIINQIPIKSIFKEAYELCNKNEESSKYLMTFQNFLTRIPRWNQQIIDEETKRIIQ